MEPIKKSLMEKYVNWTSCVFYATTWGTRVQGEFTEKEPTDIWTLSLHLPLDLLINQFR